MSFDELARIRRKLRELFGEYETVFDESWMDLRPMWDAEGRLEPLYALYEYPDKYVVMVDLPAADPSTLSIDVKDRKLIVSCRLREEISFSDWGTVQKKLRFREFVKVIELPSDVDISEFNVERKGTIVIIVFGRKH